MAKNIAVYGIYPNRPMVELAVEAIEGSRLPQRGHLGAVP